MATTTEQLPQEAWRPYFDELNKHLGTVEATIEVAGRDLGAQIAAERLVLRSVSYDEDEDVLVFGLDAPGSETVDEEYEHVVESPQALFVAFGPETDMAIEIEDAKGHQHIVRLERPPALPPPDAA